MNYASNGMEITEEYVFITIHVVIWFLTALVSVLLMIFDPTVVFVGNKRTTDCTQRVTPTRVPV